MNIWLVIGLSGQLFFGTRFLIQWFCSEKRKESHIPVTFWYCSLAGGIILLGYAIHQKDPVFIIGQSTGVIVYLRNLMLISRRKKQVEDRDVVSAQETVFAGR